MSRVIHFLASCLLFLPLLSRSAALPGDLTGLWFDDHHPGWGLGLAQQNDTVFATLFTYEANGAPSWYVASLQREFVPTVVIDNDLCGTVRISGILYRTQWPSFGSATNPQGSMQFQGAGRLTVMYPTVLPVSQQGCDRNTVNLQYSIGDAQNFAAVTRETWSSNQARLYGQYAAGLVLNFAPLPCPPNPTPIETFIPPPGTQLSMSIAADGANPAGVRLLWGTGIDTACQISGTYSQRGQFAAISGAVSCGPVGVLTSLGSAQVSGLYVSDSGFVGDVVLGTTCPLVGTVSGARRP